MSDTKLVEQLAKLIQKDVGWFNGWFASSDAEFASCKAAACRVLRSLKRRGLLRDKKQGGSE